MTGAAVVTIAGNLTADPELRFTESGIAVATFNVAQTDRRFNEQTSQWEDVGETLFLRVSVWREQGQNIASTLHKGDAVVVVGTLKSRSWQTDAGEKRTAVEVRADVVSLDLRRMRVEGATRARSAAVAAPSDADDPWGGRVTPISASPAA